MAQFALLATYREIVGREPQYSELQALLRKYRRGELIFLLAKLNAVLGTWRNEPNFELDSEVSRICLKAYVRQLAELKRYGAARVVFSRMTLLYLIKQACLVSEEAGALVNTDAALADVGLAALMANDLMLPFVPTDRDGTLERLVNLFPFSDYISTDGYATEIARGQKMFAIASETAALKARSDFVDVGQRFEEVFGLRYLTFCELIFGCATKFLDVKMSDLLSPDGLVLRETFFQNSTIPTERAKMFFEKFALSEADLAQKIKDSATRPGDDFTILQGSPLIRLAPNMYTCFDPGFLVDKAGRSLYWTLFSALTDNEKSRLASFWGAVFEEYVNQLLGGIYPAGGAFVPAPKFPNGDEAFDGYIYHQGTLIVFETKSSTLRADAKYGGNVEMLKKALHLKFVEGDDDGAKGVAQLNQSLIRFLEGERIGELEPRGIHKLYPCLVCLDNAVAVPYVAAYFKQQFKAIFPRKRFRQTVATLFTLNVTDVENLLGYLGRFQLSDILESFYSNNRAMLNSLSSSEVPILKGVDPEPSVLRQGFSDFARKIERDLFLADAPQQGPVAPSV